MAGRAGRRADAALACAREEVALCGRALEVEVAEDVESDWARAPKEAPPTASATSQWESCFSTRMSVKL